MEVRDKPRADAKTIVILWFFLQNVARLPTWNSLLVYSPLPQTFKQNLVYNAFPMIVLSNSSGPLSCIERNRLSRDVIVRTRYRTHEHTDNLSADMLDVDNVPGQC